MRKETENWIIQAEADLDAAEKSFAGKIYYLAAFLCHQAVEKFLKAFTIEKQRRLPEKTHDLVSLGKGAEVAEHVLSHLRTLNPHFKISRYPDAANGAPCQNYDERNTVPLLESAREVIQWLKGRLTGPA